jgi:CheY-like chemotaxis protein
MSRLEGEVFVSPLEQRSEALAKLAHTGDDIGLKTALTLCRGCADTIIRDRNLEGSLATSQQSRPAQLADEALASQERMSKSILIVDDNEICRRVTRLFLETQIGLQVCGEAVDGLDGVQKVKTLKPDLILLDLVMPRMNGIEAASIIKRDVPQTRIVLFTTCDNFVRGSLTSYAGIDAVLSKPEGGWKMIECVHSLLKAPYSNLPSLC